MQGESVKARSEMASLRSSLPGERATQIFDEMIRTSYINERHGVRMITRAQRFPIRALMQYRLNSEGAWHSGTVENISSRGVLFHTEHPVDLNSPIEVVVNVTGNLGGEHGSKMVSRGKVVRLLPCGADPDCTMMAAELYHLRILRD